MWFDFLKDIPSVVLQGRGLGHRPPGVDPTLTKYSRFADWFGDLITFALGFVGLVTTAIILYGGFLYITAAGDPEKASKGKKLLGYSVTGLVIIILAFSVVNTLIGSFGGAEVEVEGGSFRGGFGESFEFEVEEGREVSIGGAIQVVASIEFSEDSVNYGDVVHLDASRSRATTGSRNYVWDFDTKVDSDGDGTADNDSQSTSEKTSLDTFNVYPGPGTYTIKLTAKSSGVENSVTKTLKVQ